MRGARVELLHVWHLPYVGLPGLSPPDPDDEFETYAAAVLDHTITAADEINGSLERRVAKGHAANELIAASRRADLVVVGCRGHGGVAGTLLGSVSQRVATRAKCLVVVRRSDP
jgi:nucleotide-binding universal stress UspA family protein